VALGSIALSVLAFISMGLGVLLMPWPGWGAAFAFGAPLLALTGVVLGGRALSDSKRRGASDGTALAGVVLCSLCFFPALFAALTCGTCNALCATGKVQTSFQTSRDFTITLPGQVPQRLREPPPDAGIPPFPGAPSTPSNAPSEQARPSTDPADDPTTAPEPEPAPALPPPPLAPGPRSL